MHTGNSNAERLQQTTDIRQQKAEIADIRQQIGDQKMKKYYKRLGEFLSSLFCPFARTG